MPGDTSHIAAPLQPAGLILHPVLATKVSFAAAQNGATVIKRLGIENTWPDGLRPSA